VDFTVILPTFWRPQELAGCLTGLAQLDDQHEAYEVIVVNDGDERDLERSVSTAVPRIWFLWQVLANGVGSLAWMEFEYRTLRRWSFR
jgi:GT2 family glycosyltransferase